MFTTEFENGIKLDNQTNGEFVNNSIIRLNEPPILGGDYGFYLTNISTPVVKNNIIQGFSQGIYSDHSLQNFKIFHNNWWRINGAKLAALGCHLLLENL
ncbi:MAG: right-handed parallel beta-helix repeat-containing protein [Ignavibacteriales bacterium]|nr:right-handed parallel beta-helix repeat-containing protein [Ignavibacteriales bacterium]